MDFEGKRLMSYGFGRGEENLGIKARRKGNWGVLLMLGGAPPFLFFPTAFATLEHGLLHSSIGEAHKLSLALDGGTLECDPLHSSVACG